MHIRIINTACTNIIICNSCSSVLIELMYAPDNFRDKFHWIVQFGAWDEMHTSENFCDDR